MENNPSNDRESLWRRQPASPERPDLRGQPELELEARLTQALARMEAAPMASNFTARVMAAIDREDARALPAAPRWNWSWLLPRMAFAATVLFMAGLGLQRHEINSQRIALVRNVAMTTASQPAPSVEALENLDAIVRMSQSTHADGELLADLQ